MEWADRIKAILRRWEAQHYAYKQQNDDRREGRTQEVRDTAAGLENHRMAFR
jgi:hypothetical protein